jgi:hypothetical protein
VTSSAIAPNDAPAISAPNVMTSNCFFKAILQCVVQPGYSKVCRQE